MAERSLEVTVWTGAEDAAVCGEILDRIGGSVRPVGVGGPRSAELNDLARRLDLEPHDDLRQLLVDRPAGWLLLADREDAARDDALAAVEAGTVVLCLEPPFGEIGQLKELNRAATDLPGAIVRVPSFADCPGARAAASPEETLGPQRSLAFLSLGRPIHGSLYARLYDAWSVVVDHLDLPETIDAHLTTEPPDRIQQITGT